MYLTDQAKQKLALYTSGHFDDFIKTRILHNRARRSSHDLSDQSQLTTDLEIAAIVLGVLFVLIISFLITYRLWKYCKRSRAPENGFRNYLRQGRTSRNKNKNFMDINKNVKRNKPSRTPSFERRIHPGNKTTENSLKSKDHISEVNENDTHRADKDTHYINENDTGDISKEQRKLMPRLLEKRGSIQSFNKQQLQTINEDAEC